ncbi:CRISPR-associated endonuclease Cas2 [soil metagenome]
MDGAPFHTPWFDEAFPRLPYAKSAPGAHQMLTLVGYDITNPKRLAKVAKTCEDFGVRVQYSFFECHLEPDQFDTLWLQLLDLIDDSEDRLVAYRIDATSAKRTLTAGTMVCTEKVVCYLC